MAHARLTAALLAACLGAAPALAESQSSNSSSNCSNGRCTRVDSMIVQDGRGGVAGWRHVEHWHERREPSRTRRAPREGWYQPGHDPYAYAPPRRRDRDD